MEIKGRHVLSTVAWVSVFALSWLILAGKVEVELASIGFWIFFLLLAIIATSATVSKN